MKNSTVGAWELEEPATAKSARTKNGFIYGRVLIREAEMEIPAHHTPPFSKDV